MLHVWNIDLHFIINVFQIYIDIPVPWSIWGNEYASFPGKRNLKYSEDFFQVLRSGISIQSRVIPGTLNHGTPLWEASHTIPIPFPYL